LPMLSSGTSGKSDFLHAADLLNAAVARDPSFLQAYCLLAYVHDDLYFYNIDHTPARLALAEAAVQAALPLRPDAGEPHRARPIHLDWGYLDYDGALTELELAGRSMPNDSRIFAVTSAIQTRQGRLEEAVRSLERAIELDPRNVNTLCQTALRHGSARRYAEQKFKLDRALSIAPNDAEVEAERAFVEVDWKAETGPLHQLIYQIRATNPAV